MKRFVAKIGLVVLILGMLSSCAALGLGPDRSVSFFNFTDKPELRARFVGTWRTEVTNNIFANGAYTVMVFNTDGSGSETAFNKNRVVTSTYSFQYKVDSTQLVMQISANKAADAVWDYNFVDNDTFAIRSGRYNFLYRRTK
ncbi:hypothetical protein FACS1894172_20910 [Spirochaetia bacterium]|nr:hypothetical protein FACS1894164_20580 [Spirochaetia bacterium]GHU37485.1 hypothetical protein FACS1894172_20910 [Spirochaetia bacterium]